MIGSIMKDTPAKKSGFHNAMGRRVNASLMPR
jgi:hypothetical protein